MDSDTFSCDEESEGFDDETDEEEAEEVKEDFTVLESEEIIQMMTVILEEVRTVVGDRLSSTRLRILLNDKKWDVSQVLEYLYSEEGSGLLEDRVMETDKKKEEQEVEEEEEECGLCCLDMCRTNIICIKGCHHRYCGVCMSSYLTLTLEDKLSHVISCPGCPNLMEDSQVLSLLLPQSRTWSQYRHRMTDMFVQCSRELRWCPGPDCGRAIRMEVMETRSVTCHCGEQFCGGCSRMEHQPVPCALIKHWEIKCREDGENSKWISSKTKDCPKCSFTIEKAGGCMHMTCSNCQHGFCWLCLTNHNNHSSGCNNVYDKNIQEKGRNHHRADLQRYTFYYNRFSSHQQALILHDTTASIARKRVSTNECVGLKFAIENALQVLQDCRRTLMNTYILPFYLERNHETEIFEINQVDLEQATEKLCHCLETEEMNDQMKEQEARLIAGLMDKVAYCKTRRKVLLDHAKDGVKGAWSFHGCSL